MVIVYLDIPTYISLSCSRFSPTSQTFFWMMNNGLQTFLFKQFILLKPCKKKKKQKCQSLRSVQFLVTLQTVARQAPLRWGFSRQDYGIGCHALLQRIFPSQEWNQGLLHCRQILYHLSHQGSSKFYKPFFIIMYIYFILLLVRYNFILRNTNLTIIFLRILRLFHFLASSIAAGKSNVTVVIISTQCFSLFLVTFKILLFV